MPESLPGDGRSAVVELAHQILQLQALARPRRGNHHQRRRHQGGYDLQRRTGRRIGRDRCPGRVEGGRSTDRIGPPLARSDHARYSPHRERDVSTGPRWSELPPIASLFEQARRIGRELGLDLTEGSTGGGSDGNFTAALGIPTLDGLGARGGGAHADDEHVVIDSLSERAALLAALLLELQMD